MSVAIVNWRPKLVFAIPIVCASITVANNVIEILAVVADKKIKDLSKK